MCFGKGAEFTGVIRPLVVAVHYESSPLNSRSAMKHIFRRLFFIVAIGTAAAMTTVGCDSDPKPPVVSLEAVPDYSQARYADIEFEMPYRLKKADGEFISVESPGYACPTLADIDLDGDEDLIVGQFAGGNMQLYRNATESGATPKFEYLEWVTCEDQRAEVPGVS